jgi:3-deoxy-D-manno-octulosonic-acid transferase
MLNECQVMVVDQIGVLKNLYVNAKLVFIGKSFTVGGAQNMIEPLAFGKPTFVGPRTENFTDVMRIFLEQDIIFQVQSPEEMAVSMKNILAQPQTANDIGAKAKKVIDQNRGARTKTIQAIQQLVGK